MPTPYEAELHEFEQNGYIFVPGLLNERGDTVTVCGGEERHQING